MPDDTTIVERTKTIARSKAGKRTALGGVSVATLVGIYQMFVTQAEFATYKQEARERSAENWRELKSIENRLDEARMEIVRLQIRSRSTKTNTP